MELVFSLCFLSFCSAPEASGSGKIEKERLCKQGNPCLCESRRLHLVQAPRNPPPSNLEEVQESLEKKQVQLGAAAVFLYQGSTKKALFLQQITLVEETHGSSGQCVSFSLTDVGSGFTAYVVFLFSSFSHYPRCLRL